MSSSSNYSNPFDLEDKEEYEMVMQINEDEEDEVQQHHRYIWREREVAEQRLMEDYFGPNPKYTAETFRKRYRMRRELFLEIVEGIETYCATNNPLPKHFHFFTIRYDATGMKSMSVIMQCTSALRQLANAIVADGLDEYLQTGEHCGCDCMDFFCMCVIDLYQPEFLRKPNPTDVQRLYNAHNTIHGSPGMLGSLDCMHWEWVNCPKGWHGQFGKCDKKTPNHHSRNCCIIRFVDLACLFGVAGANNDITVMHHSPLFDDLLADNEPMAPYIINGRQFERGYYLTDGIYPQWSCFVKSFSQARDDKIALFKRRQESARKDIERAFGVLQGRWRIIAQPARAWTVNKLRRIMYTCIILHNMILKNQRFAISEAAEIYIPPGNHLLRSWVERCAIRRRKQREPRDREVHSSLQRNLIEHLWAQEQP